MKTRDVFNRQRLSLAPASTADTMLETLEAVLKQRQDDEIGRVLYQKALTIWYRINRRGHAEIEELQTLQKMRRELCQKSISSKVKE